MAQRCNERLGDGGKRKDGDPHWGFHMALENFQGQALRNCPVGNFSEGASMQGKRYFYCLLRRPQVSITV